MSTFTAATTEDWRNWLAANSTSESEIWLIIQHQDSATPSPRYHEAIEQALCFGWIDSHHRKHDPTSSRLRFTPRTPRSTWSRLNRDRAANMINRGLMTAPGQAMIDLAKATGTWELPANPPTDLHAQLDRDPLARKHFEQFPPSSKRLILDWIAGAKRPETRQRRIERTVSLAALNLRANHPQTRQGAGARPPRPRTGPLT
ncbi:MULTISPECIES: YdeI family protein [unclassified Crossiella]|uniref:YdeI/OmpD-associated family protein n=1 Tax=unclassified Crossiella TaxID=2620835 RepID=UPI001FFFA560|nr:MULTISPECIES: YdeI/OmpD-associated family protein [unclassified Crossiella]MCK2239137.1 YdeI/OmpD-associated family protein [Crossiella sp. S99.2]MCK2251294.1 YdeI/OmpD-associated family protein [Crossiella sp. S99.1]